MRIRSLSDVFATAIAWFPFLAVLVFVVWVLAVGAMNLETHTNGSHLLVGTQAAQTPDRWKQAGEGASDQFNPYVG